MSFQSIDSLDHKLDPRAKTGWWKYRLIDTDWEETDIVYGYGNGIWIALAVINTYSMLGLPVVPNLITALQWHSDTTGHSISTLIGWIKSNNHKFAQYEEELNKYILLI